MTRVDLKEINKMIEGIEKRAKGLIEKGQGIQAIERNAVRILASTKMLKINVSDLIQFMPSQSGQCQVAASEV